MVNIHANAHNLLSAFLGLYGMNYFCFSTPKMTRNIEVLVNFFINDQHQALKLVPPLASQEKTIYQPTQTNYMCVLTFVHKFKTSLDSDTL